MDRQGCFESILEYILDNIPLNNNFTDLLNYLVRCIDLILTNKPKRFRRVGISDHHHLI